MVIAVGAAYLTLPPAPTPMPSAAPNATPGSTATPTPRPTRSSTLEPAPSQTDTATGTLLPTDTPIGDVTQQLLRHIPAAIQPTCLTTPGTAPILARADCNADDGDIQIGYLMYDSEQSMLEDYEGYRLISGIEPSSGNCTDPRTWPAENPYGVAGRPAGRWLCTEATGETTIYWTDDQLQILSQASHVLEDQARIIDFWVREAGPYP